MSNLRIYHAFQFVDGCSEYVVFDSEQERLDEEVRQWYAKGYVETALIVLPRKGRRDNPVTHVHASGERSGILYVAIVEEGAFRRMCDKADADWMKLKANVSEQCAKVNRRSRQSRLDDLPETLRGRIRMDDRGCWLWIARRKSIWRRHVRRDIYGSTKFNGRNWVASRLIYTLLVGEIPKHAVLLHSCDTPACVNPEHLRPGTVEENTHDMISKGRAAWQ